MDKQPFANEMNLSGSYANLSANACERYGMTWGCDGGCQTFLDGKCKNPEESVDLMLNTDRFDNLTVEEIVELYPDLKELLKTD